MAAALVTAMLLSIGGLILSVLFGYSAADSDGVARHVSLAIFITMVTLLTHSMAMFYLIGKGKAIREAVTENALSQKFVAEVSRVRRPVFSIGTLAIGITTVAALIGVIVDTNALPVWVHSVLAYLAIGANLAAFRVAITAFTTSSRIVNEVNRLLGD